MGTWPLSLEFPYTRRPVGTLGVLVLWTFLFTVTRSLDASALEPWVLDPDHLHPWQFVTATFLHADFRALLVNALGLWIFGRYVEERLGVLRMLTLLLLFGAIGSVAYLLQGWDLPGMGATGAVAGMMGIGVFIVPKAWIRVVTLPAFCRPMRLPVWLYVGFGTLHQFIVLPIVVAGRGGPSDGDHGVYLGGMAAGVLAAIFLRSHALRDSSWSLRVAPSGGDELTSRAYHELLQSEAMWRTLEAHEKKRTPRLDP